jgi:hypothetical protein
LAILAIIPMPIGRHRRDVLAVGAVNDLLGIW